VTAGVLLLAAGRARRFGTDKRQARLLDGRQLLDATLAGIAGSGLPLLVCVAADDTALARELRTRGFRCLRCERAEEGMGGTLAEGISRLPDWHGVLVALADMPWIASSTYRQIAERLSEDTIVAPVCAGRRGHPVGFGRAFFPELAALAGDRGARRLLDAHERNVIELALADPAILCDIDVPDDLMPAAP